MDIKIPIYFLNGKSPGYIDLSPNQYLSIIRRDLITARNLGLSTDDYIYIINR